MSNVGRKLRAYNEALIDRAKANIKRNGPSDSFIEDELIDAIAELLPVVDPTKARRDKAVRIYESQTKVEDDDEDDPRQFSLRLAGETYGYNPKRFIADSAGHTIEEGRATLSFKLAEMARSTKHVARVMTWNNRKAQQVQHFQLWVEEQLRAGRSNSELTWGNCIRETGLLAT